MEIVLSSAALMGKEGTQRRAQLSRQTEEKIFNKPNASKVLIILQSHHTKTIIQTVTFKERLCDGHLIKFTLKYRMHLCSFVFLEQEEEIKSPHSCQVIYASQQQLFKSVPGYTAHPMFS